MAAEIFLITNVHRYIDDGAYTVGASLTRAGAEAAVAALTAAATAEGEDSDDVWVVDSVPLTDDVAALVAAAYA